MSPVFRLTKQFTLCRDILRSPKPFGFALQYATPIRVPLRFQTWFSTVLRYHLCGMHHAAFFCPFTFAHRFLCAAAIFLRADTDMVRFGFDA
jgi:hypothetical protein